MVVNSNSNNHNTNNKGLQTLHAFDLSDHALGARVRQLAVVTCALVRTSTDGRTDGRTDGHIQTERHTETYEDIHIYTRTYTHLLT